MPSWTGSPTASSGSGRSASTSHDAVPILGFGRGHQFDTNQYVDLCRRLVTDGGGEVRLNTQTRRLLTDGGRVVGAELEAAGRHVERGHGQLDPAGDRRLPGRPGAARREGAPAGRAHAAAVEPAQRRARATGWPPRSAPPPAPRTRGSTATWSRAGIPFADPSDFVDLSLYYSEHALLFNLAQRAVHRRDRWVTTSRRWRCWSSPRHAGLLIADARVFRDWIVGSYVEGAVAVDKFAVASRRGGRTGMAESLDELDYLPEEWGYDGPSIRAAVEQFNKDAAAGSVEPGRALDAQPLDEGPWYVIECEPAVTFPFHGVRIDDRARVLGPDGSPVPGLLAAGSDTGGPVEPGLRRRPRLRARVRSHGRCDHGLDMRNESN